MSSLAHQRALNRERVRRHRARRAGKSVERHTNCTHCGCKLSKYADPRDTMCAPCFREHGTHLDYIDTVSWRVNDWNTKAA